MTALVNIFQALLILAGAPLIGGIISTIKAHLQRRRGASIWRPYADLGKLLRKENLTPPSASFLFRLAPLIVLSVTAVAALLIPVLRPASLLSSAGDLILLIYLLALARFSLVLGGMDGGGAFGGMGGSREVLVSALAEVPFVLALTAVAILAQTTRLGGMAEWTLHQSFFDISPVHILAFSAVALVAIAETGRMPVDNPTTHLELTMIHEAMVLEHSGPSLGFLELASAIKLNAILSLLIGLFFPWGMATAATLPAIFIAIVAYAGKILILAIVIALVESGIAKMRMYAVPDFLGVSTATSILAVVFTVLGRR
jgi:formate hydrogenlyase subunit 4